MTPTPLAITAANRAAVAADQKAYVHGPVASPSLMLQFSLGYELRRLGRYDESLQAFARAAAEHPDSCQAHLLFAHALLECSRIPRAIESAERALRLGPDLLDAKTLYATALAASGDIAGGLEQVKLPAVSTAQALLHLGTSLLRYRLFSPASKCLKQCLDSDPGNVAARHLFAAVSGVNPEHPADEYVRLVFDQYAATFDTTLTERLNYRVPRDLVTALVAEKGARARPWDVLDLGCGTGLVGTEISSYSRSLVGVDLSPNMINISRERRVYSELMCCDIATAVRSAAAASFDVITAADVFIYVGKIDSVIAEARRALRPGGMFAFSAESAEEQAAECVSSFTDGYVLSTTGRYLHTSAYLEQLAARNQFAQRLMRRTQIRLEGGRPEIGWLIVWAATQGAEQGS